MSTFYVWTYSYLLVSALPRGKSFPLSGLVTFQLFHYVIKEGTCDTSVDAEDC